MSYSAGLAAALGSLAISDKDLTRIERLGQEMKNNAWALKAAAAVDADRVAGKIRTALIANAAVTALSTGALLIGALKIARSRGIT